MSADVDKQLVLLRERVMLELRLHHELQQLQGMLEPILATSVGPIINQKSQTTLALEL